MRRRFCPTVRIGDFGLGGRAERRAMKPSAGVINEATPFDGRSCGSEWMTASYRCAHRLALPADRHGAAMIVRTASLERGAVASVVLREAGKVEGRPRRLMEWVCRLSQVLFITQIGA